MLQTLGHALILFPAHELEGSCMECKQFETSRYDPDIFLSRSCAYACDLRIIPKSALLLLVQWIIAIPNIVNKHSPYGQASILFSTNISGLSFGGY
jgi:hypothetical protein